MIYSHSRLATFETCPLQFNYTYIEKPDIELKETIEAFMGVRVHETLEFLYKMLHHTRRLTLKELLEYYSSKWNKNFSEDILVIKNGLSHENYFELGKKCIENYYRQYHPFKNDKTIALEKHVRIDLDGTGKYIVQGYIDRLSETKKGHYIINDYKTGAVLPTKKNFEQDRQLALYAIAVLNDYPDAKKIDLKWHYLSFGKTLSSSRTKKQLEKLKIDIKNLIDKIESTTEFKPKPSALCDYCSYQKICPEWKHLFKTNKMNAKKFKNDSGVVLANKYIELKNRQAETEKELELVKNALFEFAKKQGVSRINASDAVLVLREYERVQLPLHESPERRILEEKIKSAGLWRQYSTLNPYALKKDIDKGLFEKNFSKEIEKLFRKNKTRFVYINKKSKEK